MEGDSALEGGFPQIGFARTMFEPSPITDESGQGNGAPKAFPGRTRLAPKGGASGKGTPLVAPRRSGRIGTKNNPQQAYRRTRSLTSEPHTGQTPPAKCAGNARPQPTQRAPHSRPESIPGFVTGHAANPSRPATSRTV